ncbi:MAG: NAD(P)H-dependent flavin oxidoreductase [Segniliparus sp.]|uniref:NAD(P)H-dependent flavin oxidoreductase n=1 Tax=Segniliparus sp. TaxID=2804064 RepID=UPI003F31D76E
MAYSTKLTEMFGIEHPLVLAPMGGVAGGRLAGAVSAAGALGFIGAGYGGAAGLDREFALAGDAQIGVGFITWTLAQNRELLDAALRRRPVAVWLSFGDPEPYAAEIRRAGAKLVVQVQNIRGAAEALAAGADVLVAQGTEAGGHGGNERSTFSLLPEVVDLAAKTGVPVLAAGGVVDGRGLAAALALGAEGAVVGSRFVASEESLLSDAARRLVVAAGGDDTVRTRVYDVARDLSWPGEFTGRVLRNAFIDQWHGHEDELAERLPELREAFASAVAGGDFRMATVHIGEGVGLVADILPAAGIVRRLLDEADRALARIPARRGGGAAPAL